MLSASCFVPCALLARWHRTNKTGKRGFCKTFVAFWVQPAVAAFESHHHSSTDHQNVQRIMAGISGAGCRWFARPVTSNSVGTAATSERGGTVGVTSAGSRWFMRPATSPSADAITSTANTTTPASADATTSSATAERDDENAKFQRDSGSASSADKDGDSWDGKNFAGRKRRKRPSCTDLSDMVRDSFACCKNLRCVEAFVTGAADVRILRNEQAEFTRLTKRKERLQWISTRVPSIKLSRNKGALKAGDVYVCTAFFIRAFGTSNEAIQSAKDNPHYRYCCTNCSDREGAL